MKTISVATVFWIINIKFRMIASADLFVIMALMIFLDFITGVIKASLLKQARTSEGYRKTVIKFLQYGGAVCLGFALQYISGKQPKEWEGIGLDKYIGYITQGLICFIIFIEASSVLENIYEVDKKSPFSRYFIAPLLKLMKFQIKNNPISKQANNNQED